MNSFEEFCWVMLPLLTLNLSSSLAVWKRHRNNKEYLHMFNFVGKFTQDSRIWFKNKLSNHKYYVFQFSEKWSCLPLFWVANAVLQNIDLKQFLMWFSAGYSCHHVQLVLPETGISRQFWTLRGGMLCWRQELLLGMFCIPLPGSGQVASSKKEGTASSKKEEKWEGKEQFIIKVLWRRRRHFHCKPDLKLEPDALHLKAA